MRGMGLFSGSDRGFQTLTDRTETLFRRCVFLEKSGNRFSDNRVHFSHPDKIRLRNCS